MMISSLNIKRHFFFRWLILLFVLIPLISRSQEGFSVSYNYGNIYPHNVLIKPLIKEPVRGFTVSYTWPNSRGKEWRKFFNYPNYGISYNFKSYGNPEELGNSHSLTSFFQISFLPRRKYFDIGFLEYTGIGYFSKKYDPVTNPENQAISTNINISADLRIYTRIRVKPVYIEYSRGLNHFSNGLIKAPNLGINVKNNSFTLGYEMEDLPERKKIPKSERIPEFRHELWSFASIGVKAVDGQLEQKKYFPVNFSLNYSYRLTMLNKIGLGMDFIYDSSLSEFAILKYNYPGEPPINFRYGLNIHNEFVFGNTGFYSCYGFFPRISEYYTSTRYYKVGLKFYFKNVVGVVLLRAVPLFRADLVELGIGYRITSKKRNINEN